MKILLVILFCFVLPSVCNAGLISGVQDTSQDAIDFFRYDVFGGNRHHDDDCGPMAPVPEPATIILMSAGVAGIVALRKKKTKTA